MPIETRNIDDLQAYAANSRTHSASQIEKLAASLAEFGMAGAVVTRGDTIAKGHGTSAAVRLLYSRGERLYAAPGRAAGGLPFPAGTVPVIDATGWTDEQFRAFVIADNQLALDAGWDLDVLRDEVGALLGAEYDVGLLGFDDEFLADLLGEDDELNAPDRDADAAPEPPAVAVSRPGDVWKLDGHRVMCGDSTSADDVARLMDGEEAELLHADPPYGMGKQKDGVLNDNLYAGKLDAFQMQWWAAWTPFLAPNASAYVWGNAPDLWRLWYVGGLSDVGGWAVRNEITWDKHSAPGNGADTLGMFANASERCLFLQRGELFHKTPNASAYWTGWDPIREYLAAGAASVALTPARCGQVTGKQMFPRWFTASQWSLIQRAGYEKLQAAYPLAWPIPFDALRAQYDALRPGYREHIAGVRPYFDATHDTMRDTWHFERVRGEDRHGHATPKPVAMMVRAVTTCCPANGVTVEPFAGSGATLMGAELAGRRCYTMELAPEYVDVTVRRWQDYTGKRATHADTGEAFGGDE